MHCISNVVRTVLLSVVAFKGIAATTDPEPLQPLVDIPTDIKSQPLADALTAWAQLTGYQIVVPQSKAAERITAPIKGDMTAQESLDRLLAGTGLIFERINDRTVAIHEDFSGPLPVEPDPKAQPMLASLEMIEVTGSRIPMPAEDIKANGWPLTPAPVTVFNRKKLDQLGVSQTADFLDYLPQSPFRTREFQSTQQFAQTRGLAFDSTLVLINGRRTVPSALAVASNAFDLNTVPQAAVQRIEVLPASASAVYGSDAIGGVINIITKKNINDTTLDFEFGTASGGGEEQRAALTSGYSNEWLRTSIVLEYYDRSALYGSERERLNNQDFRRFGSKDYRSLNSNPGNVRSLTSDNLPGLQSSFAAMPAGSTGINLTPESFLGTSGQENKDSLHRFDSALPEIARRAVSAFAEVDLSSSITAFGDVLYVDKSFMSQFSPEVLSAIVPATNPFNPFGVDVAVDYLFEDIGPRRRHEQSEMWRALGGLRGMWYSWGWELSVLRSDDLGRARRTNEVIPDRVEKALNATNPAEALNVFQDGLGGNPTLLASLVPEVRTGQFASTATHGSGVLRGPVFELPAGLAEMVVGGEWRAESVHYDQPNPLGAPGSTVVNGSRNVSALFGELRVPLVSALMQVPAISDLSITLAARRDHYSDFGSTFNPQYGVLWKPTPDVTLRASYGTSFRAPSQFELFLPKTIAALWIPDPLRNGQSVSTTIVAGGNRNLDPTEARSATVGIVIAPIAVPELQFTATYWRIDMEKLINVPPFFLLAATEPGSSNLVVRADPTAEDIAAGLPGVLTYMDISRINLGSLSTSGVDFTANYSFETSLGSFAPSISATWVNEYETVSFPDQQPKERVGVVDGNGTIPRWRIVASLGWSLQGLNLSTTLRHTPHYWDTNGFDQIINRRVRPKTLLDVQAALDLDRVFGSQSGISGLKVTAGISNLLDEEPSFSEVYGELGFDPSQGDLRQRFGYIKLSKQF
jgi:iron complex outermembrane recepter protein